MYPNAENAGGRFDQLDPDNFKYTITAREIKGLSAAPAAAGRRWAAPANGSTSPAAHLVLGLSGGIACYKAAELARVLVKAGATVQVVMTEAAEHFITPVTMQALSGRTVDTQPVGRARAEQHGAHQPDARGRCGARRAGQRRLHRQAGRRAAPTIC